MSFTPTCTHLQSSATPPHRVADPKNPHPSATGEETNGEPAESSASEEERASRMRGVAGRAGGNRLEGEDTAAQRGCAPGPGSHTELRAAGRALTSMSE